MNYGTVIGKKGWTLPYHRSGEGMDTILRLHFCKNEHRAYILYALGYICVA